MEKFKPLMEQIFFALVAFATLILATFASVNLMPSIGTGTKFDDVLFFGCAVVGVVVGVVTISGIFYLLSKDWKKNTILSVVANATFIMGCVIGIFSESLFTGLGFMILVFLFSYLYVKRRYKEDRLIFFLSYFLFVVYFYFKIWVNNPISVIK